MRTAARLLIPALLALSAGPLRTHEQPPLIDVHIHYNRDAWQGIAPRDAVRRLREAGIHRAFVSSTPDEGTQKLYEAAPQFVVPVLRPYRHSGERATWASDESIIAYIQSRLARHRYAGIGEFHLIDNDARSPVVRRVVELAMEHGLFLHVHSDSRNIGIIFEYAPGASILWAHAGFEYGATVQQMLERYDTLWADLSFRREIFQNGRFLAPWEQLLTQHADRFMVGVDTYTPQRWLQTQQVAGWFEALLSELPDEAAQRIARGNAERLIRRHFAEGVSRAAAPSD